MNGPKTANDIIVRETRPEDFSAIERLCRTTYPDMDPWTAEQLAEHLRVFPEGQHVAVERQTGRLVGMTASLILRAEDYPMSASFRMYTGGGTFANHDPERGDILYGAEVMVSPRAQGRGVGSKLYAARRALLRKKGLRAIRAGARMRGYSKWAARLSPEEYAASVSAGRISDPTLSFQRKRGFEIIGVARDYLRNDPPSRGHAAVIEWAPEQAATVVPLHTLHVVPTDPRKVAAIA